MVDLTQVQVIIRTEEQAKFLQYYLNKNYKDVYHWDDTQHVNKDRIFRLTPKGYGYLEPGCMTLGYYNLYGIGVALGRHQKEYFNVKEFDEVFHNEFIAWQHKN